MSLFKIFGDYFYTRRIAIYKRKWKFFGTVFILISLFSSLYIAITWVLPQIFATAETSIAKDTDAEFNQGTLSSTEVSGTGTTAVVQLAERAGWYDSNWFYRKPITITNSGSELTDYQVLVTVDTASLISANKMQSDCDDIRFADSSGTELPSKSILFQTVTQQFICITEIKVLVLQAMEIILLNFLMIFLERVWI